MGLFGNKGKKIKSFMERGAVIVDVRNDNEFAAGHCKGSKNIPLSSLNSRLSELDKSKPVVACCASGIRSGVAKGILKSAGFEVMNGGGWQSVNKHIS